VAAEPVLRLGQIQGNSVAGFRQDHQAFVFGRITHGPAFRRWLARLVPTVATARQVLDHNRRFRELRDARGSEPDDLVATWRNVAFTASGLRRLVGAPAVAVFKDEAFLAGLPVRSGLLGDPQAQSAPGHPHNWAFGGTPETEPHMVVIVASDDAGRREKEVEALIGGARGWRLLYLQRGDNPPGPMAGHEHFGFRDGISQPGLRGRGRRGPDDLVTPRDASLAPRLAERFARPGQPLLWPGQVVLGARAQSPLDAVRPGPRRPLPGPEWCRDGSFLVIRRLRQDVAGFWALARRAGRASGREPIAAAARLVGRWPSGAPLVTSPDADDPAQARRNDFVFESTDPEGRRCPLSAHIRKVNPRDVATEQGGANDTLTRLMARRGIPYGPALAEPWRLRGDDGVDRGLVFAAYMTSIVDQFEFLPKFWINDPQQPEGGGHDPLIGQEDAGGRRRFVEVPRASDGSPVRVRIDREVVVPTGGGYFLAPSIRALASVLSAGGGPR
jgi:Dyp-type peroxidase family